MSTSWDGFRRRFAWSKVHEFMARLMLHAQRQISAAQFRDRCCLYFQVTGRGYVGDGQRAEALALPCPACATST